MTVLLYAPAEIRRSKKRCAAYQAIHEKLRQEIEEMRCDAVGEVLASALELALADLVRSEIDRLRETW